MSYYMLYALLLVVLDPNILIKLLLVVVFAFIAHGLQLFLTLGSEKKPAAFTLVDIGTFGMLMPSVFYLGFGIFNFANLRGTLLMTALTAFFTLIADSFLEAASGRKRINGSNDNDDGDNNDNNEK